ncbi:MAG: hypothetical protein HFP77_00015 [Methylococcales symbiont of Iophon sp. n. MRB-2018]|nr:MAG: hypothetical protein HFP77_00015 [Methylococcales symbiont of Iophon sp. n. MRB-2018]
MEDKISKSKQEIITVIDTHMQKFNYKNSDWYVGIASDPRDRLFNEHNVNENNGTWVYEQASSDSVAREIEKMYINTGHDGGDGGGNYKSVYIYAYVKHAGTIR